MSAKSLVLVVLALALLSTVACAGTVTVGAPVIDRPWADNATYITILDPSRAVPTGTLTKWTLHAFNTGDIKLQVFRPVAGGYQLVGQNIVPVTNTGVFSYAVPAGDRISVQANDILGFRYISASSARIVWSNDGGAADLHKFTYPEDGVTDVAIGGTILNSAFTLPNTRTYSLAADIQTVPEPASLLVLGCGLVGLIRRRRS